MKTKEIPYDQFTPITAYAALGSKGCCILESSPGKDRYSFVGIDPIDKIEGQGDYAMPLRAFQKKYAGENFLFLGAPIGYIGYDQSYFFQVYQSAVIFDHKLGKAYLATIKDQKELKRLYEKLSAPLTLAEVDFDIRDIEVDRSDQEYGQMIERAKEYMRKGDVYQVVLSRTFKAKFEGSPFQFYRALRRISPSPFLFFFDLDPLFIVGASPEKIISVQDGSLESMPIAGSCPKGNSIEDLLANIKETAEHVMLVDLARNDIGKVSVPGSVKVTEYKTVHEFSHITHIVSKVVGKLDPQFDAIDAFQASFPAGTLSGAPKKRAMEIIQEIEGENRGLYGGAIVAFDRGGNLTSCIAIRTALIQNGEMTVRAGAGMVLDSDPQKEAEESRCKANTILEVASAFNHR